MQEFLERVTDILECDEVTPQTRFRTLPDWDSLKGFGLMVLLENTYAHPVTVETFLTLETVADLARAAGVVTDADAE